MTVINTISTAQQSVDMRTRVAHQRAEADRAASELSTGFKNDVYAERGASAAQTLELRARMDANESFQASNGVFSTELDMIGAVLSDVQAAAGEFFEFLIAGDTSGSNRNALKAHAERSLAAIVDKLNTTYNGSYLFSGLSTDTRPLSVGAGSTVTYDGDPGRLSRRIDADTVLEYGVNAGDPAFMAILGQLTAVINDDLDAVTDFAAYQTAAAQVIASAREGLTGIQADLGDRHARLERTIANQENVWNILNRTVLGIEGVDPEEAAIRLEAMTIQLQSTFEVTARMSKLSLLSYI